VKDTGFSISCQRRVWKD